jgi:alpha-glucosidase (family GH31 glycosyl hydrolase)
MFGMPHSGADVCGFKSAGDTLDEELCLRWYQLATFFPLARHSQDSAGPRTEPFNFKNQVYAAQVKKTMHDRMQYLRLMYTCLFETSDSGGTCLDPIQFRYVIPDNKWNKGQLPDFTTQFMFAGSLLVSPIMNATGDKTTFQAYFPKGSWVNMANWAEIILGNDDYATLQVRDTVNAHLAPGAIIPFQNNSDLSVMTTT